MIVPAFQVHRSLLGLGPQLTPALASGSPSLRHWHRKLQCPRHLGVSSCNRNNFINSDSILTCVQCLAAQRITNSALKLAATFSLRSISCPKLHWWLLSRYGSGHYQVLGGLLLVGFDNHCLVNIPGGPSIPSAVIGWLNSNQVGCWLNSHHVGGSFVSPIFTSSSW